MVALRCCCARSSLSSATCCLQIALERLRQSCDDEFWMIFLALALSLSMFLSSFKLVLKNASKSYFEIRFVAGFRLEKSWDDLRLSWEELRWAEKMWEELRRVEKSWGKERRYEMRWDEVRNAEKTWDEVRWEAQTAVTMGCKKQFPTWKEMVSEWKVKRLLLRSTAGLPGYYVQTTIIHDRYNIYIYSWWSKNYDDLI